MRDLSIAILPNGLGHTKDQNRVNIHIDLDEAFRRAISGNEMSADEEE